ncbi:MAG: class I SAM-dependent methyltransferase [Bryobacteraceae bacterium]|nr:class I SAM-dependent methyltransferase [Bryobacteraceae bacterium]
MKLTTVILLLGVLPAAAQKPLVRDLREHSQVLAPYVTSPQPIVDRMLELAEIKAGETVYDLGCGDGRILIAAAQKYKARGVGVELSEKLVHMASDLVRRLNLQDQVAIRHAHILDVDLSDADVVFIYLETSSNEILRPNLERYLKAGSRVISHDFEVRGWKATKVEKLQAYKRNHLIFLYQMPASLSKKSLEPLR